MADIKIYDADLIKAKIGGVEIVSVKDEDNMASDSATDLATQQSIKAYVDAQVTAQDLDFQGDSGGALSIDLDSETLDIAGGSGVATAGSGNTLTVNLDAHGLTEKAADAVAADMFVIADSADSNANKKISMTNMVDLMDGTGLTAASGVLSVDASQTHVTAVGTIATGTWEATDVAVAHGGTGASNASGARSNLGLASMATQAHGSVDIDGGAIDGAVIGANSAAAGTFAALGATTGTFTGDITLFDDQQNADAKISIGTSATEALEIQVLNGASDKTAHEVLFQTKTASGTANHGKMTFKVDENFVMDLTDSGIGGTLTTAAQTNITSVGTLTALVVSGGVNIDDGGDGAIDGCVIGAATAAAGTFTSLVGTSLNLSEGNITNVGDLNLDTLSADAAGTGLEILMSSCDTGKGGIVLADNHAQAMVITEDMSDAAKHYMKFVSTDNQEQVEVMKGFGLFNGGPSAGAFINMFEGSNNGANRLELRCPASLGGDIVVNLPSSAGTLALTTALPETAYVNVVNPDGAAAAIKVSHGLTLTAKGQAIVQVHNPDGDVIAVPVFFGNGSNNSEDLTHVTVDLSNAPDNATYKLLVYKI
jgi:hypothetical protein